MYLSTCFPHCRFSKPRLFEVATSPTATPLWLAAVVQQLISPSDPGSTWMSCSTQGKRLRRKGGKNYNYINIYIYICSKFNDFMRGVIKQLQKEIPPPRGHLPERNRFFKFQNPPKRRHAETNFKPIWDGSKRDKKNRSLHQKLRLKEGMNLNFFQVAWSWIFSLLFK